MKAKTLAFMGNKTLCRHFGGVTQKRLELNKNVGRNAEMIWGHLKVPHVGGK